MFNFDACFFKDVAAAVTKDPVKETILQTARLFVRNLAFSCTDADLLALFGPFGEISQASGVFIAQFYTAFESWLG